jgi:hypothetical protein
MNSYIDPRASTVLNWPIDNDSLTVGRPFCGSHVMRCVERVHKTSETESRVLGEQSLAQVLGGFEVLQVFDKELRRGEVGHHFHLAAFVAG